MLRIIVKVTDNNDKVSSYFVSVSKSAPDPKVVSSKIPVVTIADNDDVVNDDDGLMDTSQCSRRCKMSPGDSDSSDDSDPVSLQTEKRTAGDSSGLGDAPSLS